MSAIKKWLLGTAMLLMVVLVSIGVIFSTQSGSRWVISNAAQFIGLNLDGIQGDLLTGMDIANLDLEKKDVKIHAEKIIFRWQPLAIFNDKLSIQSISAEKIQVQLSPTNNEAEPKPFVWPSLTLPMRVQLTNLSLRDIHLQQGERQLQLDSISGSLKISADKLILSNFIVNNSQFNLTSSGSVKLYYPYVLNLASDWTFSPEDSSPWQGKVTINGDITKLNVFHELQRPLQLASRGTVLPAIQDKTKKPLIDLSSEWSEQDIPALFLQNSAAQEKFPFLKSLLTMQGNIKLRGWLDDYQIQGAIRSKTQDMRFSADLDIKGVYAADTAKKTSPVIKWHVEKLQVVSQPLGASGATADKSFLQLNGDLSLSPQLKWDMLLQGEHVNIGAIFVQWPSDLKIYANSRGEFLRSKDFSLADSRITIDQLNIQGELRGLNLASTGAVDFDGHHWKTSNISASLGANQLSLKGKAGNDIALAWEINAPMLNQIDPAIRGSVISSGTLTSELVNGNLSQTKMQMATQINQLVWAGYAVANLHAELKSTDNYNYHLTLGADQVELQQQKISQITLDANGSIAQHNIFATIQAPAYGRLDFSLDSGWKNQQWTGEWQKISWTSEKIPQWILLSSTPMSASKSHFDLKSLCLTTEFSDAVKASPSVNKTIDLNTMAGVAASKPQQPPSICLMTHWDAQLGLSASINAAAVPLRHASGWLKPQVALDGSLQGSFIFDAKKNHSATADFHLQSQNAQFVYQHDDGSVNVYPIERGAVDMSLKNNQMDTALIFDWGKYGTVDGNIKYLLSDKKLQGKIAASIKDLAPLETMSPYLNDVKGSVIAKVNVAGAVDNPDVTGNVTLTNGSANLPQLGLELKEIGLDINSQTADLITVNGQILSGEGRLMLKGTLTDIGADNWRCQGNIFGADISVINKPELSANISPNLTFTADSKAINLNGSTEIPWARAAIKALPSTATRVSADVVVVEADDSVLVAAKKTIPFYTNVILYFGDDVHFAGFGLEGKLSGKVNVFKEEKRQMLTTGFIAVNNGVYKAYGQELSIERGRLIFQGPYDDPGLDIRAVRTIDADNIIDEGVRVGLDISGTLQQPKSKVFSVPVLNDTTAMALLLTGKPLDQLSAKDAYPILAAVSGMGVEGGPGIKSNITNFFRLDEITIKEDKNLDQNALLIGKNITPRLTIRYIVGLLDQAFSLGMSYRVTNKVRVDAESGKKQSVDVIYKIER